MIFKFKITGKNMNGPVIIETTGITGLQAILKAEREANNKNLDWEEIEYI